LADSLLYIGCC